MFGKKVFTTFYLENKISVFTHIFYQKLFRVTNCIPTASNRSYVQKMSSLNSSFGILA